MIDNKSLAIGMAINGGGGGTEPPAEAYVIDKFGIWYYSHWDWFWNLYSDKITFKLDSGIGATNQTSLRTTLCPLSVDLNYLPYSEMDFNGVAIGPTTIYGSSYGMFNTGSSSDTGGNCHLYAFPVFKNLVLNGLEYMFKDLWYLRYLPELENATVGSKAAEYDDNCFYRCESLREISSDWMNLIDEVAQRDASGLSSTNYAPYRSMFYYCFALDEVVDIPVFTRDAGFKNNMFSSCFNGCTRVKRITFKTNSDGTPITANWISQYIDLRYTCGVGVYPWNVDSCAIIKYNSGITADKQVTDAVTYAALKDDPDWWTAKQSYSRYNHDSAVETINSLPDCSEYCTAQSGTNYLYLTGSHGASTDGGAINTLTDEEIAVASAKGWTVTLS